MVKKAGSVLYPRYECLVVESEEAKGRFIIHLHTYINCKFDSWRTAVQNISIGHEFIKVTDCNQ